MIVSPDDCVITRGKDYTSCMTVGEVDRRINNLIAEATKELVEKLATANKESDRLNEENEDKYLKIIHLEDVLSKTSGDNVWLVEKCEKLKKENALHKTVCKILNNDLFDLHNKYESKLHRQKELIRSLKKQRRYLVNSRHYWIVQHHREFARTYFVSKEKRMIEESLNQTILNLNKQIGEMRVKLANEIGKNSNIKRDKEMGIWENWCGPTGPNGPSGESNG